MGLVRFYSIIVKGLFYSVSEMKRRGETGNMPSLDHCFMGADSSEFWD